MNLDHYQANSLRLKAERIAHNTQTSELADQIGEAATRLAQAEKSFGADSKQALDARTELRKLKQQRANIKFPALIDPLPELEAWAKANPKAEAADPITPDVRKSETPLMAYNRLQQATANLLGEIRRIETAPLPADEAASPLHDQIDELAAKGAPQVVNGRLAFPKTLAGTVSVDHAVAVFAWLDRDRLKKAVSKMLALNEGSATMTAEQRGNALASAFVQLADALRQESAVATEAEKAGQRIVRRRNVHPAILVNAKVTPGRVYSYLCNGGRA